MQKPKWVWKRIRVDDLPRNPIGSPGKYSKRIAKKICLEIATTARGIKEICEKNSEFPSAETVYGWLFKKPAFFELWSRAKVAQAELLAEQIVTIADTPKLGQITTASGKDKEGKPIVKDIRIVDMVEHRRLQIEARKWMASKLMPKKYGDRLEVADARDPLGELLKEFQSAYKGLAAGQEAEPKAAETPPQTPMP